MSAIHHNLVKNTWHLQCPTCNQLVCIDREVFTGKEPFPEHVKWSASWFHRIAERLPQIAWWKPVMNMLVSAECAIRSVTERFEPRCSYTEKKSWDEVWSATGIDSFGPTK